MTDYASVIPIIRDIDKYKHFQNIAISGFPLCVFPRENQAWTGFVSLLAPHPDNIFVEKCMGCRFKPMCCGVPAPYISKFSDIELRPPSDKECGLVADFNNIDHIKSYWDVNINHQRHHYDLFFKNLPGKILDVGTGFGEFVSLDPQRITGIDNDPDKISNAMARSLGLDLRYGDACRLDFPDKEFDGIFCLFVLEHMVFEEAKTALKEMSRVLKPGGKLLVIAEGKDGSDGWGKERTTKYTSESFALLTKHCHFRRQKIINGAYVLPYADFNFDAPEIKFSDKQIAIGLMAEK